MDRQKNREEAWKEGVLTRTLFFYPDEFASCDGSAALGTGFYIGQQKRKQFGFSYVSQVGNDVVGTDFGEKIHIVYGCLASPSEKGNASINESPEAATMSWEVSTTPIAVPGSFKPTSHIYIDTTKFENPDSDENLVWLRNKLYGTDATTGDNTTEGTDPTMPTIAELIEHFGDLVQAAG